MSRNKSGGVELERTSVIFNRMIVVARRKFVDLGTVDLCVNEKAGKGKESVRQFGYTQDRPLKVCFAEKIETLPDEYVKGLVAHEIGHVIDFRYGKKEVEKRLHKKLPDGDEKRADKIAEYVFGESVKYGNKDIQCMRCKGKLKRPKRLGNPAEGASSVYEEFHGVPSEEVLEYVTRFHIHEHLGGLGRLVELVFFTCGPKPVKVTMNEDDLENDMWLAGSEDRKQLYIMGAVKIDLEELGYRPDVDIKDANALGYLVNVVYETRKTMNQLKLIEYDHRLGKRERWQKVEGVGPDMNKLVGEAPILAYHPLEERLTVIGGQYLIIPEGISN